MEIQCHQIDLPDAIYDLDQAQQLAVSISDDSRRKRRSNTAVTYAQAKVEAKAELAKGIIFTTVLLP